jgi:hypothetical protein
MATVDPIPTRVLALLLRVSTEYGPTAAFRTGTITRKPLPKIEARGRSRVTELLAVACHRRTSVNLK